MKLNIPETNPQDNKRNEIAFEQAYGKSYRKMRKEELAQMIVNQSINVNKYKEENYKVAILGLTMKRQRDWFHKLCRKKDGKE